MSVYPAPDTTLPLPSRRAAAGPLPASPRSVRAEQPDPEALFREYQLTGSQSVREQLILMHRDLVRYLARRFAGAGEPLEELVQVGYIGLIHAVDRFDPSRGTKFITFATPTILGEIRRYFRDSCWRLKIPRNLQELNAQVRKVSDQLSQKLGRFPTVEELADRLQVSEELVLEAIELGPAAYEMVSLDTPVDNDGENSGSTLADVLGAEDDRLAHFEINYRLRQALDELEPQERLVIQLKFFADLSQDEIALRLKCSQMQVSRIQRRALSHLRQAMEES